jgi:Fe(3+) dicitrate transport protein
MLLKKSNPIKLFFIIICYLTTYSSFSQKNLSSFTIIDEKSQPIPYASVQIKKVFRGAMADEKGHVKIDLRQLREATLIFAATGFANQEFLWKESLPKDSIYTIRLSESSTDLKEIVVLSSPGVRGADLLPEIEGVRLHVAKKAEQIMVSKVDANLANQSFRQVFSRTPGLHIVESDPSGLNSSIAIRGLSTNRSWDLNNRQNGYDMTPDPMGYNEAYYTPALEWVEKIQIIRGAAALQYGPQVGGLLNYQLENPEFNRPLGVQIRQTLGSWNLASSLIKLKSGNDHLAFIVSHQFRKGDGFRPNSSFDSHQSYAKINWKMAPRSILSFELTYAKALAKQAGGLTEQQFLQDSNFSNRSRNYFSSSWILPVLKFQKVWNPNVQLEFQLYGILSSRTQLGFTKTNEILDTKNTQGLFTNRQLDVDKYNSYGTEIRLGIHSHIKSSKQFTSIGIRLFQGNMLRQQQGVASAGADFDPSLIAFSQFPRELNFTNENLAVFIENGLDITSNWKLTLGARWENILSKGNGRLALVNGIATNWAADDRYRNFWLGGIGTSYKPIPGVELFSNLSQSFRPVSFSDLLPAATTDVVDPNLKDAKALSFDVGIRGKISNYLRYDLSYFDLVFSDRIGTISQKNNAGQSYLYKTNLGKSRSNGWEIYTEIDPVTAWWGRSRYGYISLFGSMGITNAFYQDFALPNGANLQGKRVETAPEHISRVGLNYSLKSWSITYQWSYTSHTYSDAQNTEKPNEAGTLGIIPAYTLQDISFTYKPSKHWQIKGSANNITNEKYFTRRGTGAYPGIGILPGETRNYSLGLMYML